MSERKHRIRILENACPHTRALAVLGGALAIRMLGSIWPAGLRVLVVSRPTARTPSPLVRDPSAFPYTSRDPPGVSAQGWCRPGSSAAPGADFLVWSVSGAWGPPGRMGSPSRDCSGLVAITKRHGIFIGLLSLNPWGDRGEAGDTPAKQ